MIHDIDGINEASTNANNNVITNKLQNTTWKIFNYFLIIFINIKLHYIKIILS